MLESSDNKNKNREIELYQPFKQLINTFYYKKDTNPENKINNIDKHFIKIEPKIIYHSFQKIVKVEFRIGDKQLYKLKNLPEFYDRMLKNENYKYGTKLEFIHTEDAFIKEDLPLLKYILKYAEIIKYANESVNNYTGYYSRTMEDGYITVSNTGMDELFEVLQDKYVVISKEYGENRTYFSNEEPDIKFKIKKLKTEEYSITSNIDVYAYQIIEGKNHIYFLYENILYKCSKLFQNTTLKVLEVFKSNYTKTIKLKEQDLPKFFSIIFPKIKDNTNLEEIDEKVIEKYVPKDLYVKLYLDFNEENYIIADIKFIYGENEFNPLTKENIKLPRDIAKENEVLDIFVNTGFMLDMENSRLILADEEKIYNFLSSEIEYYMQKFEVLSTDNFKKKEIRSPQISNIGVKIQNNLLSIDFSNMDFDLKELKEVMQKYNLKKKYHRLKDGSFLKLNENDAMDFITSITSGLDVDYKEIQDGELKLPLYRSMYLDKLLQKINNTVVIKDDEYRKLIRNINNKEMDVNPEVPKKLNADLRNYQKIGFQWLSLLDKYELGGILADDMGLGKTVQMISVVLSYIENNKKTKPSIVVCPSSLSLNWENEVKKFAPTIKTMVIHGNSEDREKQIKSINKYDIIITSYDLLKRDIELYKQYQYEFKYIIADEAQYIKNNNTQNARTIKQIRSETRYALTGTPIENSLSELWSIFDFIMPGYLFGYKKFKELYEIPIAKDNDELKMDKLKMLIEPFILRRTKKEVLTELPDKTITVLNNEMQEEQLKIYAAYVAKAKKEAIYQINENGLEKSQIKILALLMRLRQICCHPSLFLNNYTGESSKLNQCIEVVQDAVQSRT